MSVSLVETFLRVRLFLITSNCH